MNQSGFEIHSLHLSPTSQESWGPDQLGSSFNRRLIYRGIIQPDVSGDRTGKQKYILKHETNVLPQIGDPETANIYAVD